MLKKIFSLIVVGVMVISLVGCGGQSVSSGGGEKKSTKKRSSTQKVYEDDEFLDYYYVYDGDDEKTHLTDHEIAGKTVKFETGRSILNQANKIGVGGRYSSIYIDCLLLLDNGHEMFSGVDGYIVNLENLVVKNADSLFDNYKGEELNVSRMNTANINNMDGMFRFCTNIVDLDLSKWDVSNVESMKEMFFDCESLKKLDVSTWDVSNVESMKEMFYHCWVLKELDVSKWDVSNVKNMHSMFCKCNCLQNLDLSKWDVSKVEDIDDIFWCGGDGHIISKAMYIKIYGDLGE